MDNTKIEKTGSTKVQIKDIEQLTNKDIIKVSIERVSEMVASGVTMPDDYNYQRAIQSSMLVLMQLVDNETKKPLLSTCTKLSVYEAMFKMVSMGLDVSKKQGYFIKYGNKITFVESYFGNIVLAKRASKYFKPIANVVHEGDVFDFGIDPKTGFTKIYKHETKLENLDKPIVAAYAYVTDNDGDTNVKVMTDKQIRTAWSKSRNFNQTVHNKFGDEMAKKTVINSACKIIINTNINAAIPILSKLDEDIEDDNTVVAESEYVDFEPENNPVPEVADEAVEVADIVDDTQNNIYNTEEKPF